MKVCAQCGTKIGRKDRFCGKCGGTTFMETSMKTKFCVYCGAVMDAKAKYCAKCGKSNEGDISLSFLSEKKEAPENIELDFLKTPEQLAAEQERAAMEAELEAEAKRIEEESVRKAKEDLRRAEEELRRAEEEAARKIQEERMKAEEAARKAREERRRAEEEAARKAEEERKRAEEEAARKAEEERKRAEEEAARRAEEERKRAEEEAARRAEEERRRAEEEARRAEEERRRAEEEAARKAEEERRRAEEEAARKAEEERRRAEEERRRAEEEAARKAEEERRRAEEEAARKAEEERRKAEEAARKAEEERRKKEIEALRTNAVNAGKKAISKDSRVDLEAALDKFHVYYDKAGKQAGSNDVTDIYCTIEEILGITYYQEKSYKLATPLLQDAYEHGKGRAGIYMADWCLRHRKDISDQEEKLRESLEAALAEKSLMEKYPEDWKMATMALARIYEEGIGVDKNPAEAFKNYLACAELGDVEAMALVGNCYLYGEGVKKDTKAAFGWNEKAAMEGNERAIRNVAISYDFGTGVKRNAQNAIEWYKKLLEKIGNDRFAKYRIAMCLSDPDKDFGIKPTQEMYEEAIAYANQAINEGEDNANYVLGYCYTFGKGVEADYAQAYQYYSKAATHGNQKAKQKLNDFSKNGMGMYVYKKK